jgi:hypothetical protein
MDTRRIFVACQLSQGAFSGELVFTIETTDSGRYVGLAPRRDCRKENGDSIRENELAHDAEIREKLATRLIANGGAVARVALPDGEAVKVPLGLVSEREAEIPHVSV